MVKDAFQHNIYCNVHKMYTFSLIYKSCFKICVRLSLCTLYVTLSHRICLMYGICLYKYNTIICARALKMSLNYVTLIVLMQY